MSIRTFLFICCAAVMVSTANAENPVKPETPETPNHPTHKLMDKRVSELMADRVGFKKDMALKELAEINEKAELEARENLMFPADELYGEWTNEWVNPFRGKKVDMPDSCVIDCSTFVLPMDSMTRVTSKYGPRRRRMHKGIDLKVQIGDTIRAAFDGKVRIKNFERRGYGYYLVIRHPNGLETVYGHLSKFLVGVNDIVRAGDPIALGGNTGRSTGSHLHFETRFLGKNPTLSIFGKEFNAVCATIGSIQHTPVETSLTTSASFLGSISFKQYALAPELKAAITSSDLSCEVNAIIFESNIISLHLIIASIPFMPGSPKSIRITSGLCLSISLSPSKASSASATTSISSFEFNAQRRPTLVNLKSSTIITLIVFCAVVELCVIENPAFHNVNCFIILYYNLVHLLLNYSENKYSITYVTNIL